MDCLMLPISCFGRGGGRRAYEALPASDSDEIGSMITVVAGKEKREFLVHPVVLKENQFRLLLEDCSTVDRRKGVVFLDVDSILFEHLLWLMHNDLSSFFKLNLKEVIEFYSHES